MNTLLMRFRKNLFSDGESGMELVQVAILIAIAVVIGLIFNKQITGFVNGVFKDLMHAKF